MTFNCTQYKEGTKFIPHAIKKSQWTRNEYKSIQQKGWSYLFFSGLEDNGGRPYVLTAEDRDYNIYCFSSPVYERGWFPGLSCHITKKDSWHERVPQTLWQGRPLHLVSQHRYSSSYIQGGIL